MRKMGAILDLKEGTDLTTWYETLYEAVEAPVLVLDGDWRVKYANAPAVQLTGIRTAEMAGQHLWTVLGSKELARACRAWCEGLRPEALPVQHEWLLPRGQEKGTRLRWTVRALRDGEGDVRAWVHTGHLVSPEETGPGGELPHDGRILYRALVETSPDAIGLSSIDGRLLMVNQQAAAMFGYESPQAMLAQVKNTIQLVAPHEHKRLLAAIRQPKPPGAVSRAEYDLVRRNGSHFASALSSTLVYDDAGQPYASMTVMRDISEQRERENAIRESEARFRSFVEQSTNGIMLADEAGIVVEWNTALQDITGIPAQAVLGRPLLEVHIGEIFQRMKAVDDISEVRTRLGEFLRGGRMEEAFQGEFELRHADGRLAYIRMHIFPIQTPRGTRVGGIINDTTERKVAEQALFRSKQRLEMAIKATGVGLWERDFARSQDRPSPQWTDVYGYTTEDFEAFDGEISEFLLSTLHPDDVPLVKARFEAHLAGESELYDVEFRARGKEGDWHWVMVRGRVIERDTAGQPLRIVGTHLDITERKRTQQHLFELEMEHERHAILTRFIRDASHEFRTPLATIQNNLYLLGMVPDEEKRARLLAKLQVQTESINRLVEDLVTMARLDALAMPEEELEFDPNDLIRQVVQRSQTVISAKGHRLALDLAENLPWLGGSYEDMALAVQRLLNNAIRYTPDEGDLLISTWRSAGEVVIEINDNGVGIEPEDLSRIFDRFFRVDEARSTRGFGLGLSIAQRIVELHGGTIEVESVPGEGSAFRVRLPLPSSA